MRINHNSAAMNTQSRLSNAQGAQAKSLEKLSSGLRINRAGDDAAGLAISEKMRGQIGGLNQAVRNAQDGISLIQTAEGALNETHSIINRMRELAVQGANDTNTGDDLAEIQKEFTQLSEEVNRIGDKTDFNTKSLLNGAMGAKGDNAALNTGNVKMEVSGIKDGTDVVITYASDKITATKGDIAQTLDLTGGNLAVGSTINFDKIGLKLTNEHATDVFDLGTAAPTINVTGDDTKFQIGANQNSTLDINISDMRASALGAGASTAVSNLQSVDLTASGAGFDENIKVIDAAIKEVSSQRSQLGAWQNRLDHTINNLNTSSENLQAAESRIRDVDMAKEMMEFTKNNILSQAGTAMLAQANQMPQAVLQLLG